MAAILFLSLTFSAPEFAPRRRSYRQLSVPPVRRPLISRSPRRSFKLSPTIELSDQFNFENRGDRHGIPGEDLSMRSIVDSNFPTGRDHVVMINDLGLRVTHEAIHDRVNPYFIANASLDAEHGTGCAGVIAASPTSRCARGIAPNAILGGTSFGTRLLGLDEILTALSFRALNVSVQSNSFVVDHCEVETDPCPGREQVPEIRDVLADVSTDGRQGKGVVVVFAAGNDALQLYDVNLHTLANWRFVISVGAVTNTGQHAYYSTVSAALSVVAPSALWSSPHIVADADDSPMIRTISAASDTACNLEFTGTSAATPEVAAVTALVLEANPELTAREAILVLMLTATKVDPRHRSWTRNAAGYRYSPFFGFGRVNASRAVAAAQSWFPIEDEVECEATFQGVVLVPTEINQPASFELRVGERMFIETVVLNFTIDMEDYSNLRIAVTSPQGTEFVVKQVMNIEDTMGLFNRTITIRGFLGETSNGTWKVTLVNCRVGASGSISGMFLSFFGTLDPLPYFPEIEGADPYGYRRPARDRTISLENTPVSVYYPFSVKLAGTSTSCSYFTFLEDHDHSTRYNFGKVRNFETGVIIFDVIPPSLPNGWSGAIVFDSYDCDEDIRVPITVTNALEENGLWVYREADSDLFSFFWRIGAMDGLPAEAPGDSAILTIQRQSDHLVLTKFLVGNIGVLERVNLTGALDWSDVEFIIAPGYCFKLGDLCDASYSAVIQNASLFPALDPTPDASGELPLTWILIIGGLGVLIVILLIVIVLLLIRKRRAVRKQQKKARKAKTLNSSGYLSEGLIEIEDAT
jgi:subtilisin-like proprotein convertase family protein